MSIKFDDANQDKKVKDLYAREEEELAQILSTRYGLQYADLSTISINTDGLRLIPEENARKAKIAVFDIVNKNLKIAVLSPNKIETQNEIKDLERRGYAAEKVFLVSNQSLELAWARYKDLSFATESKAGSLEVSNEEIDKFISQVRTIEDAVNLIKETMALKKSFRISRIVEIVIACAIATNASDIHVEPEENFIRLRLRLDGVLVEVLQFDIETYKLLLSRIKLLSGMKLNVKNTSQDGRFSVKIGGVEIEVRTSVLPGAYNESIVMRLLNPKSISVPLEELGIEPYLLEIFQRELDKPNGMLLNTGPTGSGKTTTLYAFMKIKRTPDIKIITIEDPIEYHLEGVVQTQVDAKKGYDFAKGLKSSLRQDPDVIMVGEIRDIETAETAVHAALTGHLVFSTLHTNNAAGAFTRLIDLGINPKILTSAINISIAQRLVRRLCPDCRTKVPIPPKAFAILKRIYDTIKNPPIPFSEVMYAPGKCEKCHEGYRGRIAIFEAVLADKNVEEVLQLNPSEREIKKAASSQGIMDMAQDGVIKILRGISTIEEVERVVDLESGEAHGEPKPLVTSTEETLRNDFDNIRI